MLLLSEILLNQLKTNELSYEDKLNILEKEYKEMFDLLDEYEKLLE